jgi:hypothetical protein
VFALMRSYLDTARTARASLNGTHVNQHFITGAQPVCSVAVG